MREKIKAKYFNFIRNIQLNILQRSTDYIDSFINELYSNHFPYKLVYLFRNSEYSTPLCEIKISSPLENCFDAKIEFIGYEQLSLFLSNYSMHPVFPSYSSKDEPKRKIENQIDNDSIDIKFQEMREFIDRFFGENFSYSFIDNNPAKATQIAVYNLVVSGTIIPLEKPLCFKRNIDHNGTYSFPKDNDIRQLIEYGFILELVEPLQYYQENSSSAYPVYQLVYNPKDTHNYETNLQLLNALAKRGDLGKFNAFFTDLTLSPAF